MKIKKSKILMKEKINFSSNKKKKIIQIFCINMNFLKKVFMKDRIRL